MLVLKGQWKFAAMAGGRSPNQEDGKQVVEVYGGELDSPGTSASVFERDSGGFGGDLSNVLSRPIAVEATGPPAKISYHFNYFGDRTAEAAKQVPRSGAGVGAHLRSDGAEAINGSAEMQAAGD